MAAAPKKPAKPRKPRQNLTAAKQVERNAELVQDKMRNLSWDAICTKYDLSLAQAKRIFTAYRHANRPRLEGAEAFEIVWEAVEQYEQMMQDLALVAATAGQDAAAVGAINAQARILGQKIDLLQKSGILPQNLGKLKVEHDVRYIISAIVKIFVEDDVLVSTQRKVLDLLREGAESTN